VDGTPLVTILTRRSQTAKVLRVEKRFGSATDRTDVTPPMNTSSARGNPGTAATADVGDGDDQSSNWSQLLMLSIPSVRVTELGQLDAIAIQPILATGTRLGHLDLMVLHPKQQQLALYRGLMRLCDLRLPAVLPPLPDSDPREQCVGACIVPGSAVSDKEDVVCKDESMGENDNIVINDLTHAVSRRVNIVLSPHAKSIRVSVPMLTQSSILTPVLAALDETLAASLSLRLRVDVAVWYAALLADQTNKGQTRPLSDVAWKLVGGEGLAATGLVDDMDLEWAAFLMLVARLLALWNKDQVDVDVPPLSVNVSLIE
jgi:hypothetical protein